VPSNRSSASQKKVCPAQIGAKQPSNGLFPLPIRPPFLRLLMVFVPVSCMRVINEDLRKLSENLRL